MAVELNEFTSSLIREDLEHELSTGFGYGSAEVSGKSELSSSEGS